MKLDKIEVRNVDGKLHALAVKDNGNTLSLTFKDGWNTPVGEIFAIMQSVVNDK